MRYKVYHLMRGLKYHIRQGVAITQPKSIEATKSIAPEVAATKMSKPYFTRKPFKGQKDSSEPHFNRRKRGSLKRNHLDLCTTNLEISIIKGNKIILQPKR